MLSLRKRAFDWRWFHFVRVVCSLGRCRPGRRGKWRQLGGVAFLREHAGEVQVEFHLHFQGRQFARYRRRRHCDGLQRHCTRGPGRGRRLGRLRGRDLAGGPLGGHLGFDGIDFSDRAAAITGIRIERRTVLKHRWSLGRTGKCGQTLRPHLAQVIELATPNPVVAAAPLDMLAYRFLFQCLIARLARLYGVTIVSLRLLGGGANQPDHFGQKTRLFR